MIYATGDVHRDSERLIDIKKICEENNTTEEDTLIILGDSGINYYANEQDDLLKEWIKDNLSITLLCIHGNHEARPYECKDYILKEWNNGLVYVNPKYPNQLFAKDGEIYDLDGKKAIAIGGAYSPDKERRLMNGMRWYPSEQPSPEIKKEVMDKLEQVNFEVDMILSHTCPFQYMPRHLFLPGFDQRKIDYSTEVWLMHIEKSLKQYSLWLFGHFHGNWSPSNNDRMRMLFDDIIEI